MENFVRLKNRGAAYIVQGETQIKNQSISISRRIKPAEEVPYVFTEVMEYEDPIMFPAYTQNKRIDNTVQSEELKFRINNYPSFSEKVAEHAKYMKQKLRQEKMALKLEQSKLLYQELMEKEVCFSCLFCCF